jgi:hypothetical protein
MRRAAERRHGQFAQSVPVELTGMNWLLPMYWSSTAEPWLLTMLPVETVLLVLGSTLTLHS